ncbi:MAG: iron chaperone [Mucilaginibacter sp.]
MSRHNEAEPQTIDEYIAMQPEQFKSGLHELRSIIKSLVPRAEEMISYQVPCFKYHYMLVGIGVNNKYLSLYPMSSALTKNMSDELKGIKISGTTLHFLPGEPLPKALIEKIVMARMQENELKAMSKNR